MLCIASALKCIGIRWAPQNAVLLASLGFVLINTLNKADSVSLQLSPVFVAVSVFCFALAVGAIWEILEYTFEDLFGTSTQTYLESMSGSVGGTAGRT